MIEEEKKGIDVGEKSPLYILGHFRDKAMMVRWGHWDLNPDQRVSSTQGATLRELMGQRSSQSSPVQQTR